LLQAVEIKKENKEGEKTLMLLAFVYLASIAMGACRERPQLGNGNRI